MMDWISFKTRRPNFETPHFYYAKDAETGEHQYGYSDGNGWRFSPTHWMILQPPKEK